MRKDKIRVGVREIRELRQRLDTPTVEKAVYLPLLGATIDRLLAEFSLPARYIDALRRFIPGLEQSREWKQSREAAPGGHVAHESRQSASAPTLTQPLTP